MAEYYLCPQCNMASSSWFGFQAHFRRKHPDTKLPPQEELPPVEELPEGYTVSKWAGRAKKPPKERPTAPESKEPETAEIPEELPEDFVERTRLSLATNEIPPRLINQVVSKIKWHPLVMENANAFSNMLTSIFGASIEGRKHMAKIGWIISEVFGEPVGAGGTFVGGGPSAPEFTGIYGQPRYGYAGVYGAPQDKLGQYLDFLMLRDARQEKERPAGLPPEVNKELQEVRSENKEIREFMGKMLERLDKQEEEEKYERRFAKLEESLERKPSEEGGQNQWLKAYMEERDKREKEMHEHYQTTIKELGDKLAGATREVAAASKETESRIIGAITRDKETREETREQLIQDGYKKGDKTKEELDHDLQVEVLKIIPDKIDKGFDKIIDKLPLGGQSSTGATQEITPRPKSVTEVAEQVRIEDDILREAERRGRA